MKNFSIDTIRKNRTREGISLPGIIRTEVLVAVCKNCKQKVVAHPVRIDRTRIDLSGYFCPHCMAEIKKGVLTKKEIRSINIDYRTIWDDYRRRLKGIVQTAANQPDNKILDRITEILTNASIACGRKDMFDFNFDDEAYVVNYVHMLLKKYRQNRRTYNDILYAEEFVNDYKRLIPLINNARMVTAMLAPHTAVVSVLGISAFNIFANRVRRAALLYSFGQLAFLLMIPKDL